MDSVRTLLLSLWQGHARALGCSDLQVVRGVFDRLSASYTEAHRAYHTLDHLVHVFAELGWGASTAQDPLRLAFAAWFHDAVYDPHRGDSEERSALRAREDLAQLGADAALRDRVARLILATKAHAHGGEDAEADLFLDADLAILGAPEDAYVAYVAGVRREYGHLSSADWRTGRGAFLASTLARARIFRTDAYETRYGVPARRNLTAELRALQASHA